jgi:hypothetical protein
MQASFRMIGANRELVDSIFFDKRQDLGYKWGVVQVYKFNVVL